MAGYYDRDAVDDFDDYDPEPYTGGYDQVVAYGKPIPPSDDTCYTPSTPNREEDESHGFAYGSESCPYGGDCVDEERPMHGSGTEPSEAAYDFEEKRPMQGSQPGYDFDEPKHYQADEFGQRPPPPRNDGYSEGWKKPGYGDEAEGFVPEPARFERPESYEGEKEGEEEGYRKGHRASYTQEEEEASPRLEKPDYRQDEGYERPEYGGEEYEEGRHERPAYHNRRNSYTQD